MAAKALKAVIDMVELARSNLVSRKALFEVGGVIECVCADFDTVVSRAYLNEKDEVERKANQKQLALPLQRIAQSLSCVHTELLNVLFRMGLQAGVVKALHQSRKQYERKIIEHKKKVELTGTFKTDMEPYVEPYTHPATEGALLAQCKHNLYQKSMLLLQMSALRPNLDNKKTLLEQALKTLNAAVWP